jgi:hypothetical protein
MDSWLLCIELFISTEAGFASGFSMMDKTDYRKAALGSLGTVLRYWAAYSRLRGLTGFVDSLRSHQ